MLASQAGRRLVGGMDKLPPDHVAGATISARAMRTAVLVTARLVLRPRLARPASVAQGAAPTADTGGFTTMSVDDLIANNAVAARRVTSGDVAAALARAGATGATLEWPLGASDDLYIEFVTALVTPEIIGGNLLGIVRAEEYTSQLPPGSQAIYIASSGPYDFFGTKYFQASQGNLFDRIRLVQGGRTFTFHQRDYTYALPASGQQLAALLALPPNSGFDPQRPWRLDILVHGTGARAVTLPFGLDYTLPDFVRNGTPPPIPPAPVAAAAQPAPVLAQDPLPELDLDEEPQVAAWVEAWSDARTDIVILSALLAALTAIFVFQDALARHRLAHRVVRMGFLAVVLVWLGWTAGVQLSTVNVINYAMAPFNRFEFGFYLAEPLMVIIAVYTLFWVILIGRGVFCGWLCPFGALQELLGEIAKALRIPQWSPPVALERRLWWGKYISAAVVLLLVVTAIDPAGASLEVGRIVPIYETAGKGQLTSRFFRRAIHHLLETLGGIEDPLPVAIAEQARLMPARVHELARRGREDHLVAGVVEGRLYQLSDAATALQPRGRVHYFINETKAQMAMIWVYAGPMPERVIVDERCATVEGNPWKEQSAKP
jgi:transcriptional regulator of nitric oxide reductase